MKRKITGSIFLTALGVLVISLALVMGFLYDYFGDIQENQLKTSLDLITAAVEENGDTYLQKLSSGSNRFTLIAADGTVLYDTDADAATMENHADREEVKEAFATGVGESRRYSATLLRKTIYRAVLLNNGTVLRISVSSATVLLLLIGMYQVIILILIIMTAASAITGRLLSKHIVKPLDALDLSAPLENDDAYPELSPLLRRIDGQNTEIRRKAAELQRKQDEFTKITGNMKEGLVLLDNRWRVLSINKVAADLFECGENCIGEDFIRINRASEIVRAITEAFNAGKSEIEYARRKSTYHFSISRIESDGNTVGTVILIQNITERLRAEAARIEFTANVSHEMKTPLQNIIGRAGLILQGGLDEKDTNRFAKCIQNEAVRMSTLMDDILYLSGLDKGITQEPETVSLRDEVSEVMKTLDAEAKKKSVTVTVSSGDAVIKAPRNPVYEIILNLCSNAVRYNTEGGSVCIDIADSEDQAVLTVTDSGIGIPSEDIDRIFERFYRVDKSRSRRTGGTGLGLSIVKHAAELIGARVSVQSAVGSGSAFSVTFSKSR